MKRKSMLTIYKKIPIVILILCLLYIFTKNYIVNYQLRNKGIKAKAIVYEKKHIGAKGVISTEYYFIWKGNKFYGDSDIDGKFGIGDTMVVFFLESNPNINRSNTLLEIDSK